MAYSTNPNLPKARAIALRMLIIEQLPLFVVANRCGVHRSTIYCWRQKWLEINKYRQTDNPNRPTRPVGTSRLLTFRWPIPTSSSAPHHSPQAIGRPIIDRILELKENHGIILALSTIYRWLHRRFTKAVVGIQKYKKHKALVTACYPREVVEHDTVDLGGGVYAYTAMYIFTKEPSVVIGANLEMNTGAEAFVTHNAFYGSIQLPPVR